MIIYAIPGLGTTKKLFVNTTIAGVEIKVLDWPLPEKNDTMQSYARKFLPQINTDAPFCLLGVSFGGMLCVELARIISPKKIFLISTSKTRKELPWFIRFFKHVPIHKIVSEKQHRKLAYQGRWLVGFGKAYIPEFLGMVNSMSENYFQNCINIIVNWNGTAVPKNSVHIHGDNDKLLKYKFVKADHTIPKGSHAMIVFQAEEINRIIENELKNLTT
jgi:esterase/lipase